MYTMSRNHGMKILDIFVQRVPELIILALIPLLECALY